MTLVHGTALSVGGFGVLLRGPSGAGKSSLALRLIDQPGFGLGAALLRGHLVADDQVFLEVVEGQIMVRAPENLKNLLEIRGVGLVRVAALDTVKLDLIVDLMPFKDIERMPDQAALSTEVLGVYLKRLMVDADDPAAAAKIRCFL